MHTLVNTFTLEVISQINNIHEYWANEGLVSHLSLDEIKSFAVQYKGEDYIDKTIVMFDKRVEYYEVLSYLGLYFYPKKEEYEKLINIAFLATNPQYVKIGLATELLDRCINSFSEYNWILNVNKTNEIAINLYKKFGFEITNDADNLLIMRKYIKRSKKERKSNIVNRDEMPQINNSVYVTTTRNAQEHIHTSIPPLSAEEHAQETNRAWNRVIYQMPPIQTIRLRTPDESLEGNEENLSE